MTWYRFSRILVWDTGRQRPAVGTAGFMYDVDDVDMATPLPVLDGSGTAIPDGTVNSDPYGVLPEFQVEDRQEVRWGGTGEVIYSIDGYRQVTADSAADAELSRQAAEEAAAAAEAPADEVVENIITNELGIPDSAITTAVSGVSQTVAEGVVAPIAPENAARAVGRGELVIDVRDYLAVGDGETPDQVAINAALSAGGAAAAFGVPVRVRLVPHAVHAISASINGVDGVDLDGAKAELLWTGAGDRPLFYSAVTNAEVRDLKLNIGAKSTGSAVFATGCDRIHFRNVEISGTATGGAGFRLSGCTNSTIEECPVEGGGQAYNITGDSRHCKVLNSQATKVTAGVLINPGTTAAPSHIDIIGVTVKDFPTDVDGNPTAVMSYPIRSAGSEALPNKHIRFIACTVIGLNGHGYIDLATPGGTADQINAVWTEDMTFLGNTSMYGGDMGISFTNCTRVKALGNTCEYNTALGITAASSEYVTIGLNSCMNNGQNWDDHAEQDVAKAGIGTANSSHVAIGTNIVGDDQVDPVDGVTRTPTQIYGIRCQLGGSDIVIDGNVYDGNSGAPFFNDGAVTDVDNRDAAAAAALGGQVAYSSVGPSATVTIAAINTWTAFAGAPSITLPNDGGIYQIEMHGTSVTYSVAALFNLGLSGDAGANRFKTSGHSHSNAQAVDRAHLVAGHVIGTGQTITIWGYASVVGTGTLTSSNSAPLELWATRVG